VTRARFFSITGALVLLSGFVAANAHLVTVAIGSQTDCVLDPSHKEGVANRAAKPSC
jgi:hypothetical protein|tara:strand:- start:26090 stop:26260 length:171 start_codon:yes stop_codon:yes gene_type:complete